MSNIIDGLVKGLSGFMPQDDPDVKIFNAQAELKELSEKEEKIFARLGRAVYDTDGGESHPEIKTELEVLLGSRHAAEERLQAARDEKVQREKAEAEEHTAAPTAGLTTPKEPTSARDAARASLRRHKHLPPSVSAPIAERKWLPATVFAAAAERTLVKSSIYQLKKKYRSWHFVLFAGLQSPTTSNSAPRAENRWE